MRWSQSCPVVGRELGGLMAGMNGVGAGSLWEIHSKGRGKGETQQQMPQAAPRIRLGQSRDSPSTTHQQPVTQDRPHAGARPQRG